MKIFNKQFGEIEFEKDSIIEFENGILGFEGLKEFLLVSEKEGFFFWLISIKEPELIFPLFSIKLLEEDYKIEDGLEPYGIVKLDKEPKNITINLKAPVLINHNKNYGMQKILENENYQVNYPLFVEN